MSNSREGSLGMLPALLQHRQMQSDSSHALGELYQTSLMSALSEGVYEGDMTYGVLHQHGDFGLGTFNELDGEMVGFDGEFYQLRSDGSARPVNPEQKAPFAVVTFFEPTIDRKLSAQMTKAELQKSIEEMTEANYFHAIRVHGQFASVTTRTVSRQEKPYPKLIEAASHQQTKAFSNVEGTLAGFRSPSYAQGIGVAGFHLHFLREDRQAGGHALDYVLTEGHLQIATQHKFHVELPSNAEFEQANLNDPELDGMIKKAEG